MNEIRLIVHGGAWNIPDDMVADHLAGVRAAVATAAPRLAAGGSALDAVETAVRVMEADPTFDAGRGAFLNAAGAIELDAMIMDGQTLAAGAGAAVRDLLHPVSLARRVMTDTEHVLLVGTGAETFAREIGIDPVDPRELLTDRELAFYERIRSDPDFRPHHPFQDDTPRGTVGAVALDHNGHLAAATSTGGTPRKRPGRVGDTPIVGAGTYADDRRGAVSATGWGEAILRMVLAKRFCDRLDHEPAGAAAERVIAELAERVSGHAGVVGIDRDGRYGLAHNTPRMAWAFLEPGGEVRHGIRVAAAK